MNFLLILLHCLTITLSPGAVKRTIDGDTFVLYAVNIDAEERVRVLGVDAFELSQPLGDSARKVTDRWLHAGDFTISGCKHDSFGRLLMVVSRNGRTLADTLISLHLGVMR
jgi:endonuclease YncB( thermonuclease family)